MILTDMLTRLRRMIGGPGTVQVSDAVLIGHLNDALSDIGDEFRFQALRPQRAFDTVADTSSYDLPDTDLVLLRIWNETSGWRVKRVDRRQVAEAGGPGTTVGPPRWYYRIGKALILVPIPDDIYIINYIAKIVPATLADDSDEPEIPRPWHMGVVRLARHLYWDSEGDQAKAQFSWNQWRLWASRKSDEWGDELASEEEDGGEVSGLQSRSALPVSLDLWLREDVR